MISHPNKALGYVALALAALVSPELHAQAAPAPAPVAPPNVNAGRLLESAPPPPAVVHKDADVLPQGDQAARPPADAGPSIQVKGFQVTGNTVFDSATLLPLLAPWVGKPAGTDQLLDAAEAVKNKYKDAGYFLTQVFVPAQDVADGVVTLRVVEARVGKTSAEVDSKRVRPSLVDGYIHLLPDGAPITEQSVERPLLLLNDLPGVKVNSVLRPGAEFGEADLLVKVQDEGKTFGGAAYVDDYGSQSTGQFRLGVDLSANGLLGQGESWSVGGLVTNHNGLDLVRGGVTAPVGPYGTKVTASATYLKYQVVGSQFDGLHADGYAFVGSLLAQHPLVRSRNFNLFAVGGLDAKNVDDTTYSGSNHDHRVLYVGNLGVTGDFRDERFGGSLNSFTFSFNAGENQIRTLEQRDLNTKDIHHTAGTFQLVDGDFQRLQSVTDTTSVLLALRGQYAFRNLDTSEKSSLGGPRGVRAYAVGDGVGDDLVFASVELRQRVPRWSVLGAPVILAAFFDSGRARNWHDPQAAADRDNVTSLNGVGVGLNVTARENFQFRLDIAQKINGTNPVGSDNRRTHYWASLQKWF